MFGASLLNAAFSSAYALRRNASSFFLFIVFPVVALLSLLSFVSEATAQNKETVGWVERVRVFPADFLLHAKLDTGAKNSSLHAGNIKEFQQEGEPWIRFVVHNRYGQSDQFEYPVKRLAFIKRHQGPPQKRHVIRIGICLKETYMEADVTLIDRTNFDYQMLIGRTFLAGKFAIDPAVTYSAEPKCHKDPVL